MQIQCELTHCKKYVVTVTLFQAYDTKTADKHLDGSIVSVFQITASACDLITLFFLAAFLLTLSINALDVIGNLFRNSR